jgi:tRNA G37 N-methylase TrmD
MAFRKYQKVERQEVLSEGDHKRVESHLHKLGKTSAADLTDEEREELQKQLAKSR